MNLDRFSQGLPDAQSMPLVEECVECLCSISEGSEVVEYMDEKYCSEDCLTENVLKRAEHYYLGK